MRAVGRTFAALAVAVVATACQPASPPDGAARPNLLVIVVDALRADRLGAYGHTRGLTPFLDSLAARGVVFQNAYSASCWTMPSVASLFTARHVRQHGVNSHTTALSASEVTLAEVLAEQGYATAAFTANFTIGASNGFSQGFASYAMPVPRAVDGVEVKVSARAGDLNRSALAWWSEERAGQGPAFLYLHYMETHTPYAPPPESIAHVFRGRPAPDINAVNGSTYFGRFLAAGDPAVPDIEASYDAEVMAIDAGLRQLFTDLEREGFLRKAVVAITADHGEELWDHGRFAHAGSLFNEVIRVPLIMLVPGRDTRLDVSQVISLIDVAPTLLDFAGLPQPPSFAGHSLRMLMDRPGWRNLFGLRSRVGWGAAAWRDAAFVDLAISEEAAKARPEDVHRQAMIVGSHKLIITADGGTQYYDLARDPLEKAPDAFTEAERATLVQTLERIRPPVRHAPAAPQVAPLDEEKKRQLRALGYAQ